MIIDYKRNEDYYKDYVPCDCELCQNYYRHIANCYPKVVEYLDSMGVDVLKPFELVPIEYEEKKMIEYIGCQYIVFGECDNHFKKNIDDIRFYNNIDTHPSDEHIKDKHFIIEFGPIVLEWR